MNKRMRSLKPKARVRSNNKIVRFLLPTQRSKIIRNYLVIYFICYLISMAILIYFTSTTAEHEARLLSPENIYETSHFMETSNERDVGDDGNCYFQQRSLIMEDTGYEFMFDVFRSREDEMVIVLSPDVDVKKKYWSTVNIPIHKNVEYVKFEQDDISRGIILDRAEGTCVEEYEGRGYVDQERYHKGTLSPMIYRCNIPIHFANEYRTFNVFIEETKPSIPHHVQDCSTNNPNKKYEPPNFSGTVVTDMSIQDVSHWLKFMHFIGFDRIKLFLHNPTREKVGYFLHNYDPSFLDVRPAGTPSYRPFQSLAMAEAFLRRPSQWAMTNDVDEYPIFIPNLYDFVTNFETEHPDVAGIGVSSVVYSYKENPSTTTSSDGLNSYRSYPRRFEEYSPILRMHHPCFKSEPPSTFEDRPKPLFRPDRVINVENHFVCPKEGRRIYQADHSKAIFNHYFGYNGRVNPAGFVVDYDHSQNSEENRIWGIHLSPCYFESINKEKSSDFVELMIRYEEILDQCEGLLCEKNEMEMKDEKLMDIKKKFNVETKKHIKFGYTEKEVMRYHDTIVAHCRKKRTP